MKDYQTITIQGWMINKLQLSGVELLVYAFALSYIGVRGGNGSFKTKGMNSLTETLDRTLGRHVKQQEIQCAIELLAAKDLIYLAESSFGVKKSTLDKLFDD